MTGLPGRGKTHFLCALGRELILRGGYTIAFTPTFKLVQQLLAAKKDLRLDAVLKKLDRFDAIILDVSLPEGDGRDFCLRLRRQA